MLPKRMLTYKGKTQPAQHWALELGCSTAQLHSLYTKMPADEVIPELLSKLERNRLRKRIRSHVKS